MRNVVLPSVLALVLVAASCQLFDDEVIRDFTPSRMPATLRRPPE